MIVSTRESQACREKVLHLGISQISGASRTSVGGYVEAEPEDEKSEQFDVSDKRTLDEIVQWTTHPRKKSHRGSFDPG
jgi:2-iminoacetate synthase